MYSNYEVVICYAKHCMCDTRIHVYCIWLFLRQFCSASTRPQFSMEHGGLTGCKTFYNHSNLKINLESQMTLSNGNITSNNNNDDNNGLLHSAHVCHSLTLLALNQCYTKRIFKDKSFLHTQWNLVIKRSGLTKKPSDDLNLLFPTQLFIFLCFLP